MDSARSAWWLAIVFIGCAACAWGQPRIGYVYPAGARQGATLRVVVGGQFLRGADGVYVSGQGVHGSVLVYVRPLSNQERGDVARFLRDLVRRRWSARVISAVAKQAQDMPPLPDHPWLRDLDEKTPLEVARLRAALFDPKKQPNAQIAEQVEIELTLAPDAPPGARELRIATPLGLSNPMRFEVGVLPEAREEALGAPGDPDATPVDVPVVLNGQIMPGEVDRFRLRARKGQRLVLHMRARQLVPYLADAVPGWFQAAMALYDPHGNEVAYGDDYRFEPDPVLLCAIAEDGIYRLEVRDAIYRGREDFVYRITVGELPFITHIFPLGGRAGTETVASVAGWNLPTTELPLDTRPDGASIRHVGLAPDKGLCNQVPYAVDTLPECTEAEPNDTLADGQRVTLPQIINGRIGRPGEVDVFSFEGRAGEEVVAEVRARRLGSPLDSALRLLDATGAVVAANDDHEDPEAGLITHLADSYLRVRLPKDGTYWVYLCDAQRQGGDAHGYRLRLGPPQPDFALRVTPSSLNMPTRRPATFTVHALRKDGFAGEIDVALKDALAGFTLTGGRIPGDKNSVQVTLTPPRDAPSQWFPLQVEGRAQIGGVTVSRMAIPAENMMQAFAYWHLVPQQELLVAVTGARPVPAAWRPLLPGTQLAAATPVAIPLGGTARVQVSAPQVLPDRLSTPLRAVRFRLSNAPRGVTLRETEVSPTGVALTFKADANIAQVGQAANLIIEASTEPQGGGAVGQASTSNQRISLGVFPPIPYEVVRPG